MSQPRTLADGPMVPAPRIMLIRRSKRAWFRGSAIVILTVGLLFGHRELLTGFAGLFRVDDPAPSDRLLALAVAPDFPGRFYERGWTSEVVTVSRGPLPFPDLNQASVDREFLTRQGIPADAIRALAPVHPGAGYREIAQRAREDIDSHPVHRLTVAVNAHHSARVARLFKRAFADTGVEIHIAALKNSQFNETDWYKSDEGLTAYFTEFIETIRDALLW